MKATAQDTRRSRPPATLPAVIVPVERGGLIASPGAVTLDVLVPQFLKWLKFVRERRENTVLAYGHDLASFCDFCARAGLTDPRTIQSRHIEVYVAWLRQERHVTAATANRHVHALRTFWSYLIREEVATHNPAASTFLLKASPRLVHYLSVEEQERVLEALALDRTPAGQRDLAVVATMLFCGLRVSEVVNLEVEDVDLASSTLRVHFGKGGTSREQPIIARLRAILTRYLRDGRRRLTEGPIGGLYWGAGRATWRLCYQQRGVRVDRSTGLRDRAAAEQAWAAQAPARPAVPWFFVATTGARGSTGRSAEPLLTRSIYQLIRDRVSPLVGRPVHPHVLRHSFASRLREHGAPLELIQEGLGHASVRTTLIYAHLSTSKRRNDLAKYLEGDA